MFNTVAGLRPKRHFFDKSFVYKTTMKMGELIPFLAEEVVSGDKYKIGNNAVVRVSPMVAPILDNIYLRTEYFFVPERLLASDPQNYINFLTGGKNGTFDAYPFDTLLPPDNVPDPLFDGSLSDYLGLPKDYASLDEDKEKGFVPISDKFHRAYCFVWNEFYRDENLQSEINFTGGFRYNFKPLKRSWKKDYFTSALLTPQRGTAPAVPIQGILPVVGDPASVVFSALTDGNSNVSTFSPGTAAAYNPSTGPAQGVNLLMNNSFYGTDNDALTGKKFKHLTKMYSTSTEGGSYLAAARELQADPGDMDLNAVMSLSDGIGFNAADIRKLMQVQKFLERNMRSGVRFNEFLLAHFGVAPKDEVLQRPRFLGSTKTPIIVSEVLQTSESTASSPQGRLSGKGLGLSVGMIGTHTFEEPGIVLGLVSIVPDLSYQSQGINKKFTRFTRYDYYFAEFAHLTEQPILKSELMYDKIAQSVSHDNTNYSTFGYQGIYDDMRHNRDMVTGQFRSDASASLDYWHLARYFEQVPALNSDFITCEPSNRIFEVQDEPPFQVCIGNILKAIRPMPKIAEPGLVDHF